MIYLTNKPSDKKLRDRFINFDYHLNDGFDLAVLVNIHNVISDIDNCDVFDDRIKLFQLESEKPLLFFDKFNYVNLYIPMNNDSNQSLIIAQLVCLSKVENKDINAVKRHLKELLPWIIDVDLYYVTTSSLESILK